MKRALALALIVASPAVQAGDYCAGKFPESLEAALGKSFPAYRMPRSSDSPEYDIDYDLKNGGSGCLSVASADFDGDANADYIVGLTAQNGLGGLVAIALARPSDWQFKVLSKLPDGRSQLYVATDKPGIYNRTEALDGPLEQDEVDPLICPNSVAMFGALESTGVAFCLNDDKWQHVWVSD